MEVQGPTYAVISAVHKKERSINFEAQIPYFFTATPQAAAQQFTIYLDRKIHAGFSKHDPKYKL